MGDIYLTTGSPGNRGWTLLGYFTRRRRRRGSQRQFYVCTCSGYHAERVSGTQGHYWRDRSYAVENWNVLTANSNSASLKLTPFFYQRNVRQTLVTALTSAPILLRRFRNLALKRKVSRSSVFSGLRCNSNLVEKIWSFLTEIS